MDPGSYRPIWTVKMELGYIYYHASDTDIINLNSNIEVTTSYPYRGKKIIIYMYAYTYSCLQYTTLYDLHADCKQIVMKK